jgi:hypothetical protein
LADHLAAIFSHELRHYLAFHSPRDVPAYNARDEDAANAWAVRHAQALGYSVQAQKP